jgi:hypothetical protein
LIVCQENFVILSGFVLKEMKDHNAFAGRYDSEKSLGSERRQAVGVTDHRWFWMNAFEMG